ncbi:probable iron/ascorbate oxidoreductase DDB_G0283291 [Nematostella vectensis]|uniref:probable iron/ascorbate oxidoreductase DDB_G0283291 n=1 Tax=Nematostella vectensis TaxID=45351 RepID=UPI002076F805|nr:probable iron/ascorbate oxidoreductase DDB_G0283291 [Nematostella vectensis]XP_048579822.1 probable iron/ascorbate oxidoreductase DDB_G0283291 [Nematostella vectensis]
MSSVPIINISRLLQVGESGLAKAIARACSNVGAFYITDHGISDSTITTLETKAQQFFKLPLQDKQELSFNKSKAFRGYFEKGAEKTAGLPDIKEGFFLGPDASPDDKDLQAGVPMVAPNTWPSERLVPGFCSALNDYTTAMTNLGKVMTQSIMQELEVPEDLIRQIFDPPFYNLTLWHYPAVCTDKHVPTGWGIGPHTDYEAVTILHQDPVGGLQVQTKQGEWVDVPPIQGTLVVLLGDALECLTNGLYRAPVHRVKNSPQHSRYSISYFFQPNINAVIQPLDVPKIRNREYKPTRGNATAMPFHYGYNLQMRYAQSFGKGNQAREENADKLMTWQVLNGK